MSDDESEEKPKKGGKKSKKLLIIIVAAVVLLAGGGAGGYFMFFKKSSAPPAPKPGIVVPLESITINLADSHYLKLKISLQLTSKVAEKIDGSKALDIAIDLFSNRAVAELSSNNERNRMKKELKEKVVKAFEEEVMDVYFTEFVMQ